MTGLVFLVICVGQEHRRQLVERQHTVGLRVVDRLAGRRWLQRGVIRDGVCQCPRLIAGEKLIGEGVA